MLFGKKSNAKKNKTANGFAVFSAEPWIRRHKGRSILFIFCVLLVAAGLLFWYFRVGHGDAATNQAEQQTLQKSLSFSLGQANDSQIISITNQLVNGQNQGKFHIGNAAFAQIYLDRAASLIDENKNSQALTAFEQAAKIDSTTAKFAALQGELIARYNLGQRQELIPILQQLEQLAKNNPDQRSGTPAQYQYDINRLQHNQSINL